jgi:hypothetical protein
MEPGVRVLLEGGFSFNEDSPNFISDDEFRRGIAAIDDVMETRNVYYQWIEHMNGVRRERW